MSSDSGRSQNGEVAEQFRPDVPQLPRFLARKRTRKDGTVKVYYFWDGRHASLPEWPLGTDLEEAILRWKVCESGTMPERPPRPARKQPPPKPQKTRLAKRREGRRRRIPESAWDGLPSWCKTMFLGAEGRAYGRRVFSLTPADMLTLWERCGGRCEVSGMPFDIEAAETRNKRPFAPSLDRIDSRKGYEMSNVRLVCMMVNFAMSSWGEEPLRQLVEAMNNPRT